MPRSKNPNKYQYAKTLLSSDHTINQVRKKLSEVFGEGISPNILIEMKKQIELEENGKFEGLKKEESEIFNSLMQKLDTLINSQGILDKYFFDKFNIRTSKMITSIEDMELAFNDSQFNHIQRIQHQLLKIIENGEKDIEEIQMNLNISKSLAKYLLTNLINASKIDETYVNNKKIYKLHDYADNASFTSDSLEEGFFIQREKIFQFITKAPRLVEDIKKEFNYTSEFVNLILYDMFVKRQVKVVNSVGKRKIAIQMDAEYESKPDDLTVDEIEEEILLFLSGHYGKINEFTEKFIIPPTKIIYALNHIGQFWPYNSLKYQYVTTNTNFEDLTPDEPDFDPNFNDLSGMGQFR